MNQFDVFDVALFSVFLVDEKGRIIFANREASNALGFSNSEFLEMTVEDLMPQAQRCSHLSQRSDYMLHPSIREMNKDNAFKLFRKNGEEFPVAIGLSPMDYEEQKLVSVSIQDITDIVKKADATALAEKMESIGKMAMSISHNFNNLLAAIKGKAYLIQQHPTSEVVKAKVRDIDELCEKSASIIKSLMAYGRVDRIQKEQCNLTAQIRGTVDLAKLTTGSNIELCYESDEPVLVECDYIKIEQCLLNLINNSKHAIGDKTGKITISCEKHLENGEGACKSGEFKEGYVCVEVADNGCGISESNMKQIFEPFFTTKPVGEGTGLGLASTISTIEQHEGKVFAASKLGQGTQIKFSLPTSNII